MNRKLDIEYRRNEYNPWEKSSMKLQKRVDKKFGIAERI